MKGKDFRLQAVPKLQQQLEKTASSQELAGREDAGWEMLSHTAKKQHRRKCCRKPQDFERLLPLLQRTQQLAFCKAV